jgi:hypothetical protein
MIKEIHCFGTSNTEGGGFEFQHSSRNTELRKIYTEEPFTKENYSWPGNLQKLVGNDIKVYNHAKSGYGNERMYRLAYEVLNNETPNNEKLLLLEFSHIGRKEYYSKSINDFFIANYSFDINGIVEKLDIAETHYTTSYEDFLQHKFKPLVYEFMKETIDFDIQEKTMKMNNDFFINYLLSNKINFLLTCQPQFLLSFDLAQKIKNNLIEFEKGVFDLYHFVKKNRLTITYETNTRIIDGHSGLEGNKSIAKIIFDKINNLKNII